MSERRKALTKPTFGESVPVGPARSETDPESLIHDLLRIHRDLHSQGWTDARIQQVLPAVQAAGWDPERGWPQAEPERENPVPDVDEQAMYWRARYDEAMKQMKDARALLCPNNGLTPSSPEPPVGTEVYLLGFTSIDFVRNLGGWSCSWGYCKECLHGWEEVVKASSGSHRLRLPKPPKKPSSKTS